MQPHTQGTISLGPSTNCQGSHKFYNLTSAKVIVRRSWTIIPMHDGVIARVNQLGADQPQLLTFYNQQNREIGDVDKAEPIEDSLA